MTAHLKSVQPCSKFARRSIQDSRCSSCVTTDDELSVTPSDTHQRLRRPALLTKLMFTATSYLDSSLLNSPTSKQRPPRCDSCSLEGLDERHLMRAAVIYGLSVAVRGLLRL